MLPALYPDDPRDTFDPLETVWPEECELITFSHTICRVRRQDCYEEFLIAESEDWECQGCNCTNLTELMRYELEFALDRFTSIMQATLLEDALWKQRKSHKAAQNGLKSAEPA